MPINDYFIFDGKNSLDYGLYMASDPNAIHPARRGELFPIPGRNGSIVREDGSYDTYTLTYDVLLDSNAIASDVYAHAREVAAWLLGSRGFCRLEDSYEPEYFRLARCAAQMGVENRLARFGRAQIPFEVQPQRYLKSGEVNFRVNDYGYGTDIFTDGLPQNVSSVTVKSTLSTTKLWLQNPNDYTDRIEATLEEQDGLYVGTLTPTETYRAVHIASGIDGEVISLYFTYSDGAEEMVLSTGDSVIKIQNPTQFEARPLLKFVDTSEHHQKEPQTLTNVNDTYISDGGNVLKVVWKNQEGKWYTTQPISTSGYDYAIITANSYTFLDSNGDSVGFDHGNFNNTKLIIPKSAATIRLGNDIGKTSSLSLQVAPLNPGNAAVTINGTTINLDFSVHDTIILDCDLHDAYYIDGSNANSAVSFANRFEDYPTFPRFAPGENTIIPGDGLNLDFYFQPRWWAL